MILPIIPLLILGIVKSLYDHYYSGDEDEIWATTFTATAIDFKDACNERRSIMDKIRDKYPKVY